MSKVSGKFPAETHAASGQGAHEEADASRPLRALIVLPNPGPDGRAGMPRGIVPDQDPGRLAFRVQPGTGPGQELGGEGRDGAVLDKAQPDVVRIGAHHPVTGQRFGLGIVLVGGPFEQTHGLRRAPRVHVGLRQPRPPDFIHIPHDPGGLRLRPATQPVPPLFFRWYAGSRLVIQSRARRHFTPRRNKAWRIVSSLTRQAVSWCSKQTSAASSRVHVERALPKVRGERCKSARSCWRLSASSSGRALLGREDWRCKQATPRAAKARRTLRTVWSVQPTCWAIWGARRPAALANTIWLRRNVKASQARSPARTWRSSATVRERTTTGVRIPPLLHLASFSQRGRLALH